MARASYTRDERGAAAAEMALILPGIFFLIFGTINLCAVTYATTTLHRAVEQAARYASVNAAANNGTDPGSTAVKAYAASHYVGPGIGATFTYTSGSSACGANSSGHLVTGTGSYKVLYGLGVVPVTINAKACFP